MFNNIRCNKIYWIRKYIISIKNNLVDQNFSGKTLNVKLGYNGKTYVLNLFNNQTAEDIYNHVSLSTWNLPIYNFEGY